MCRRPSEEHSVQDMDAAAATFDFNDSATLRLHTRLKNMLDPNGILSPGKQGVWPAARSGALQA